MDWFLILSGITSLISAIYTVANEMGNANVSNALNNDATQLSKLKERINSGSSTIGNVISDLTSILNSIENRYGASVLGQKAQKIASQIANVRNKITSAYNDYTTSADRAPSVNYSYGVTGWAYDPQANAKKIKQYSEEQERKFNNAVNDALQQELPDGVKINIPGMGFNNKNTNVSNNNNNNLEKELDYVSKKIQIQQK